MAIEYIQRWLEDAKAKTSKIGWFKPITYEVLKSQKGLDIAEPILVETVYAVTDSEVDTNTIVPIEVKFIPKVATETDYTITISDESICTFNSESGVLEFKDKSGIVDITINMSTGEATGKKTIQVNKPSLGVTIEEGNYVVKGDNKNLTFSLLPSDTSEVITNVEIFNNPEILLIKGETNDTYSVMSEKIGMYYAKVTTSKTSYKTPIYVIESETQIVESISLDNIEPAYKYGEVIPVYPTFTPNTATNKDFYVHIENPEIASYNRSLNSITTGIKDGASKVKLYSVVGKAEYEFDLVVNESGVKPKPDIESIKINGLPDIIDINAEYPFTVSVTPEGADDAYTTSMTGGITVINSGLIKSTENGNGSLTVKSVSNNNITYTKNITTVTKAESLNLGSYSKNILSDSVKHDLPITVLPTTTSNKTLTYTGSGVIKIDANKKYYADSVGTGNVTITTTDGSNVSVTTDTITVTAPIVKVATIDITGIPNTMNVGDEATFNVVVNPSNATDKTYTITNSPNLTVTGNKIVANSILESSFVTATANDGSGVVKKIDFSVTPIKVTNINVTGIPTNIDVGTEGTFNVSVTPSNATDKTYSVTSSANVTVTGNKFVANSSGASSITVTANDGSGINKVTNFTANNPIILVNDFEITGLPSEVTVNTTINNIVITAKPDNATDKTFSIRSSENIDILDNTSFTAVSTGQGTITVSANDTGKYEEVFTFNIIDEPAP